MALLPTASAATKPRTKEAAQISTFFAILLVVMAVAQLFSFEDFPALFADFSLPGGEGFAGFVSAALVAAEVFALPFLLGMAISPAFRWFSMFCSWIVAGGWSAISLWVVLTQPQVENIGFLGTVAPLMPGGWAIFISFALVILATWASWGRWPAHRPRK
jgi:hypothetical protein